MLRHYNAVDFPVQSSEIMKQSVFSQILVIDTP